MKDIHIKYKRDTGNSAMIKIESEFMTPEFDTYPLNDLSTAKEVIDLLDACDYENAVMVDNLPSEYEDDYDMKIYRPEYVLWLEEQIKINHGRE